jgi:hypothetical protein
MLSVRGRKLEFPEERTTENDQPVAGDLLQYQRSEKTLSVALTHRLCTGGAPTSPAPNQLRHGVGIEHPSVQGVTRVTDVGYAE